VVQINMGKIKLNLRNMGASEKIQFARQIVTAMNGNPNFPTPDPALANVTTDANTLEAAYNEANVARQEATAKASAQDDKESLLDLTLMKLANYVENVSNGDETIIQSAGMSVRSKPAPIGPLGIPAALSATAGDIEGQIRLIFERVYGAKAYIIEISPDPPTPTSWKQVTISTKSSYTVTDLVSGTKYWFRVAAIGAAGQGPWSDPATKIAP
jgi:hypothetical protein